MSPQECETGHNGFEPNEDVPSNRKHNEVT